MSPALRAIPAAPDARRTGVPARPGVFAALATATCLMLSLAAAQEADDLPAATSLSKITWSQANGVTRLTFHGTRLPVPIATRASDAALRLDFAATDASSIPRALSVRSAEVASIVPISSSTGILPEGISCRFVIVLSRSDVGHSIDARPEEVIVAIGDEEILGLSEELPATGSALAAPLAAERVLEQPPELAELLDRPQSITLKADMSLRAAPAAIATTIGTVAAGQSRVIDARRGEWAHVQDGGWLRLPQVRAEAGGARATTQRTPAAWSVVTLGTNLDIVVEEVLPGDERAELLTRLYADDVKLARFRVRVDAATPYAFRLPSKKGRVVLEFAGGASQESLEPTSLRLKDSGARARIDVLLAAPPLGAGSAWETYVVFPARVDFLQVTAARVEVNGLSHRAFRVPGSGEAPAP